jgi:hypothetical protein
MKSVEKISSAQVIKKTQSEEFDVVGSLRGTARAS